MIEEQLNLSPIGYLGSIVLYAINMVFLPLIYVSERIKDIQIVLNALLVELNIVKFFQLVSVDIILFAIIMYYLFSIGLPIMMSNLRNYSISNELIIIDIIIKFSSITFLGIYKGVELVLPSKLIAIMLLIDLFFMIFVLFPQYIAPEAVISTIIYIIIFPFGEFHFYWLYELISVLSFIAIYMGYRGMLKRISDTVKYIVSNNVIPYEEVLAELSIKSKIPNTNYINRIILYKLSDVVFLSKFDFYVMDFYVEAYVINGNFSEIVSRFGGAFASLGEKISNILMGTKESVAQYARQHKIDPRFLLEKGYFLVVKKAEFPKEELPFDKSAIDQAPDLSQGYVFHLVMHMTRAGIANVNNLALAFGFDVKSVVKVFMGRSQFIIHKQLIIWKPAWQKLIKKVSETIRKNGLITAYDLLFADITLEDAKYLLELISELGILSKDKMILYSKALVKDELGDLLEFYKKEEAVKILAERYRLEKDVVEGLLNEVRTQ